MISEIEDIHIIGKAFFFYIILLIMKTVDFIVVGQGIAGTLLAFDLIEARKSVAIIDVNLKASATRVAAGLINPVGMRRCIPSHNSHHIFLKLSSVIEK